MTEAPSFWLIVHSHSYDGYNGLQWADEDTINSADRGYFTSKEDAQAWIDAEKQRLIDRGQQKYDDELAHKNADDLARHTTRNAQDTARRREYDALIAMDIEPSFERPEPRKPFVPKPSNFNAEVYLKGLGLDWEIVEVEPAREVVSHG